MAERRFSIERELGEMHSTMKNIKEDVSLVKKTLSGNGHPGLVRDVNQMQGAVKALKWVIGIALPSLSLAVTIMSIRGCS